MISLHFDLNDKPATLALISKGENISNSIRGVNSQAFPAVNNNSNSNNNNNNPSTSSLSLPAKIPDKDIDGVYGKGFAREHKKQLNILHSSHKFYEFFQALKTYKSIYDSFTSHYKELKHLHSEILSGLQYVDFSLSPTFSKLSNEAIDLENRLNQLWISLKKFESQSRGNIETQSARSYVKFPAYLKDNVTKEIDVLLKNKETCLKLYTYSKIQADFYDLLYVLKNPPLPNMDKQQFNCCSFIFNGFFNFLIHPKNTDENDVQNKLMYHAEIPIKNLTLDTEYCNLSVSSLKKLDDIAGLIINYSKDLKNDSIIKAKEIIKSIDNSDDANKFSVPNDISVYRVQRLLYTLNDLLIGKYDNILNSVYEEKTNRDKSVQKEIIDKTVKKISNNSISNNLNIITKKISGKYDEKASFSNEYKLQLKKYQENQKYYSNATFDNNIDLILKSKRLLSGTLPPEYSFRFTNVNGINANIFTQFGHSLTNGGLYVIGKSTIGPAFYVNLIGSNFEADPTIITKIEKK